MLHSRTPLALKALVRYFALPAHTRLLMPALSPTMTQGVIAEWCKKDGEAIKAGDIMAKVETDKATVDFEATDDSFVGKVLVPAGEAQVGRLIAVLVEDEAAAAAFKGLSVEAILKELGEPAAGAAAPTPAAAAAAAAPPPPPPQPVAAAPPVKAAPAAAAPSAPKAAAAAAAAPLPAAAAAAGPSDGYAAWPAWGTSLSRTPMGRALAVQQEAYEAAFGFSGVALAEPKAVEAGGKGKK